MVVLGSEIANEDGDAGVLVMVTGYGAGGAESDESDAACAVARRTSHDVLTAMTCESLSLRL